MANLRLPRKAKMIAACAADEFECLEALFDAIRLRVDKGSYANSLAQLGQWEASRYSTNMRDLAKSEGHNV